MHAAARFAGKVGRRMGIAHPMFFLMKQTLAKCPPTHAPQIHALKLYICILFILLSPSFIGRPEVRSYLDEDAASW